MNDARAAQGWGCPVGPSRLTVSAAEERADRVRHEIPPGVRVAPDVGAVVRHRRHELDQLVGRADTHPGEQGEGDQVVTAPGPGGNGHEQDPERHRRDRRAEGVDQVVVLEHVGVERGDPREGREVVQDVLVDGDHPAGQVDDGVHRQRDRQARRQRRPAQHEDADADEHHRAHVAEGAGGRGREAIDREADDGEDHERGLLGVARPRPPAPAPAPVDRGRSRGGHRFLSTARRQRGSCRCARRAYRRS
jgi:hypothetical protein